MIIMALGQLVSLSGDSGWPAAVAQHVLAAPTPSPSPGAGPSINTDNIVGFIATKIAPILLAVLGVIFLSRAGKGEMSRVLTSSAIAIVGLAFIAGAGALFLFGQGLVNLIFR